MGDFKLTLDPADKLIFAGNLGTDAANIAVKLTNPLKERIVFKVKCTSNELFRIRPPVGELKAGDSTTVNLTFNQGKSVPDNGKQYFAFYYLKEEKKAPRAAWTEHKGEPEGVKKLFADFKKEEGGKKKDEKKDEKEEKKDDKKEEKKDEKKKDDKKEEKKDEKKEEEKKDDEKKDGDEKEEGDDKK